MSVNNLQLLQFFKAIDSTTVEKYPSGASYLSGSPVMDYEEDGATQWATRARTALAALLPCTHPVVLQFEDALKRNDISSERSFERAKSTFRAATQMLEEGHFASLVQGIRAETEVEILDQAAVLVNAGHVVAATILAGGALETHLRGICVKHEIVWAGDGSISKYDGGIAQARNRGASVYTAADTKQVQAWGGLRNDAAHAPTTFAASAERVLMMIDGIREFVVRTS